MRKKAFMFVVLIVVLAYSTFLVMPPNVGEESTGSTTLLTTKSSSTSLVTVPDISTTVSSTQSTTTLLLKSLQVGISPEKYYEKDAISMILYPGDTAVVKVVDSENSAVSGVEIVIDDEHYGLTDDHGLFAVGNFVSGDHLLEVSKDGFPTSQADFSVWKSSYGMSTFVRRKLNESQRREYISDGKVNVRFYDRPSCAICAKMKPRVSEIVSENRDCVVYEVISLWKYNSELRDRFTGMTTPIIEIEGPSREFQTSGLVPSARIEDMIRMASPTCLT